MKKKQERLGSECVARVGARESTSTEGLAIHVELVKVPWASLQKVVKVKVKVVQVHVVHIDIHIAV